MKANILSFIFYKGLATKTDYFSKYDIPNDVVFI